MTSEKSSIFFLFLTIFQNTGYYLKFPAYHSKKQTQLFILS